MNKKISSTSAPNSEKIIFLKTVFVVVATSCCCSYFQNKLPIWQQEEEEELSDFSDELPVCLHSAYN